MAVGSTSIGATLLVVGILMTCLSSFRGNPILNKALIAGGGALAVDGCTFSTLLGINLKRKERRLNEPQQRELRSVQATLKEAQETLLEILLTLPCDQSSNKAGLKIKAITKELQKATVAGTIADTKRSINAAKDHVLLLPDAFASINPVLTQLALINKTKLLSQQLDEALEALDEILRRSFESQI